MMRYETIVTAQRNECQHQHLRENIGTSIHTNIGTLYRALGGTSTTYLLLAVRVYLASAEISLSLVESGQLNMCSVSHMHSWRAWYLRLNAAEFSNVSRHPSDAEIRHQTPVRHPSDDEIRHQISNRHPSDAEIIHQTPVSRCSQTV